MIYLAGVILLIACFLMPDLRRFVVRCLAAGAVLGALGLGFVLVTDWWHGREAAERAAAAQRPQGGSLDSVIRAVYGPPADSARTPGVAVADPLRGSSPPPRRYRPENPFQPESLRAHAR